MPQTWEYVAVTDPDRVIADFERRSQRQRPRLVLFGAPDNPTSQILPQVLVDAMRARTEADGAWLAMDFAYKCQYFEAPPAYYSWSPADHPHVIGIHSNSKWGRGLGRRLGWLTAAPAVVEAIERVQQCSLLCPDTLSQMAMARYLSTAIADGSLRAYIDDTNARYRASGTRHDRSRRRASSSGRGSTPMGGLYTVVDVGTDADAFVPRALQATGVLVVPGGGFGPSLKNGVRISYGPMVMTPDRIGEGLSRLGAWMSRA